MEPEKASTRMKTKKTRLSISFKNTFCSKNWQIKHKSLFWIWKLEFEIWIWNVTNQMIAFSAFIQSGYRGTRYHLAFNWVPFQCSKINKYEDHFFQCSLCHTINLLLTKPVRLDFVSVHKNAKRELGQYPAILTSRLVNNIYIFLFVCFVLF